MSAATQLRSPGGKFAARPGPDIPDVAARQPTATEQLQRLKELRRANNGLLIAKPPGIDGASLIYTSGADGQVHPNRGAEAAEKWFRDIVATGGSPQDLQLAWDRWSPTIPGAGNPKPRMRTVFERLQTQAGPPYSALMNRAAAEAAPQRALLSLQAELQRAKQELARLTPDYSRAWHAVKRLEAALAEAQEAA